MFRRYSILLIALSLAIVSIGGTREDELALVRNSESLLKIMRELSENYVDVVNTDQMMVDISEGISANLDPYTGYIPRSDMDGFEMMTTGKYGGIGSIIRQRGEQILISCPYKGSPADKAGLVVGDVITEIDGKSMVGESTSTASNMLKGTPGSKVRLVVEKIATGKKERVVIMRERISIPSIPYYGFVGDRADSVGYIQHTDFTEGCYELMAEAIKDLRAQGLKSLILDYRSNGGGIMQEAISILSLFVPTSTEVLEIRSRRETITYSTVKEPLLLNTPLVVLIDKNTASAAEIVSGALQDLDRAVIIGQRSFGKGLVQSTRDIGYGAFLKLTTARYYIPSGRCIQAIDYHNRPTDGGGNERLADSLRRTFTTASGRKVHDGGGITPDIVVRAETLGRFATTLFSLGLIEDYGNEYYKKHGVAMAVEPGGFALGEADYNDFCAMIDSCKVEYESSSRTALKKLKTILAKELITGLDGELKAIESALEDDTRSNLERYKEQIVPLIERDIVSRYNYTEGGIRYSLREDRDLKRALELIGESGGIEQRLSPKAVE
ncbi:MAG: S41 family peptidase [Rikenellaceae bacterium]